MDWFETVINGVLFVSIVAGIIVERKSSKQINKRLDAHAVQIDSAKRSATDAKVNSLDAKRDATYARKAVNLLNGSGDGDPRKLPETKANVSLVERLREQANKTRSKRAHPSQGTKARFSTGVSGQTVDTTLPVGLLIGSSMGGYSVSESTPSTSSDSSYSTPDTSTSYSSPSSDSGSYSGGDFSSGDSGSF